MEHLVLFFPTMSLRNLLACCCLVATFVPASAAEPSPPWPFFAFDNGVGRNIWTPDVQAKTIKELGYDGIHYN